MTGPLLFRVVAVAAVACTVETPGAQQMGRTLPARCSGAVRVARHRRHPVPPESVVVGFLATARPSLRAGRSAVARMGPPRSHTSTTSATRRAVRPVTGFGDVPFTRPSPCPPRSSPPATSTSVGGESKISGAASSRGSALQQQAAVMAVVTAEIVLSIFGPAPRSCLGAFRRVFLAAFFLVERRDE